MTEVADPFGETEPLDGTEAMWRAKKEAIWACPCDYNQSYPLWLQRQLSLSYYWTGNCLLDFLFFIAQWHPFFGIFLSHPAHPWSKSERLITFLISIGITTFPLAIVQTLMSKDAVLGVMSTVAMYIYITIPLMLVETAFYWLAILDMNFDSSGEAMSKKGARMRASGCHCLASCLRCGKKCLFCFFGAIAFGMFVVSAMIIAESGICEDVKEAKVGGSLANAVVHYANSTVRNSTFADELAPDCEGPLGIVSLMLYLAFKARLMGWVTWIPIWTFLCCQLGFFSAWCPEKEMAEETEESHSSDVE